MLKSILVSVALLTGFVFASAPSTGISCKVSCPTGAYGTGVILNNGYVLTAAHVVTNHTEDGHVEKINFPQITFDDLSRKTARLERLDMQKDLALLATKHQFAGVTLGEMPKKGDPVWVIGCSSGLMNSIKKGIVCNISDLIAIDAVISPGDSGGPVLNDDGELVGISDAMILNNYGTYSYGLAVRIDHIKAFLK